MVAPLVAAPLKVTAADDVPATALTVDGADAGAVVVKLVEAEDGLEVPTELVAVTV
jgi:hypothetical protein